VNQKVLLPEDLARELNAPPEWVEEAHWFLPHHVKVRDNSWHVVAADMHVWQHAWERATKPRAAA
jgi:hypothetical protein